MSTETSPFEFYAQSMQEARQCPRCKAIILKSLFPKTSGGRICYCRTCKNAAERAAKKKNVAYIAMERERSRIRMRLKRQKNDDAMRKCDRLGVWIALEVHAYIPTPVEEIEFKEAWEEFCYESFPLPVDARAFRMPHRREPHFSESPYSFGKR